MLAISAEVERDQPGVSLTTAAARPALAPASRKVIRGAEGEQISRNRPTVGDVDGDGYDDFVVATPWMKGDMEYGFR
ncbi:MAG TPA: hypothetical protein VMF89_00440, partial [Polyangiales bacterium]|nr:hypothetical protein [Polyangiales bacterium]